MWRILGKFHSRSMSVKKIIAFSLAQLCFSLPQVKQDHWWCNLNDVFRIREVFKATIHREHFAVQRAAQQRVLALHRQRGLRDRGVSRHRIWGALAGGLHALHHTLWIFRRPIKRRSLIQVINALSNQREKSRGRDSIYKKNTLTVMFVQHQTVPMFQVNSEEKLGSCGSLDATPSVMMTHPLSLQPEQAARV